MAKRLFDIVLSAIALLVLLPILLVICLVLRFTGEGEVFYFQERVGRANKRFNVAKFATMVKNSSSIGTGDVTVKNDPRVLPVGRFLRSSKLNEVPQLLNILNGTMSFVGPRPQTPRNLDFFSPEDRDDVTRMRPGLTGIGSVVFRDEENIVAASTRSLEDCYRQDICPYKASLERWYHEHQSLLTDVLIMLVTVWVVIAPRSVAYRRIWKDLPESPPWLAI
jgi:lipopolysaccharide/colanic/teichoic acid biosynthesis glycosyltransferase